MKTALIAGATGLVGKQLLYTLLHGNQYARVYILVRKELAIKDPKLEQIVFSYDQPSAYISLPDADDIYCCLGTTIKQAGSQEAFRKVDYEYPVRLAETYAQKGGTTFLIVTAMGADPASSFFYNRVKGETEQQISSFSFKSIYICRPSLLLGNRSEFRLGEEFGKIVAKVFSLVMFGGLKKYKAIQGITVARAMARLAEQDTTGIHVIPSDKLQELGKSATGKKNRFL
jgi:uncharacterized protein YbjT (DUF2867 family)